MAQEVDAADLEKLMEEKFEETLERRDDDDHHTSTEDNDKSE